MNFNEENTIENALEKRRKDEGGRMTGQGRGMKAEG